MSSKEPAGVTPFQSFREYEEFIYNLPQRSPTLKSSSLVVIRRGRRVAILQGEMYFDHGYRIVVKERLSCDHDELCIEDYGYDREAARC